MRANRPRRARLPPDELPPGTSSSSTAAPPPGSPEAVFLAWLLWLPPGREPCRAARDELARIDALPPALQPQARRLRAMFAALLASEAVSALPSPASHRLPR